MHRILRTDVVVVPVICIAFLLFMNTARANEPISATERAALIALYNSTDGDNWTDNSGWKDGVLDPVDGFQESGTEDTWYGVLVEDDSVIEIDLVDNQLSGTLPFELGNLSNLDWLQLYGNQLTGSIPSEIGSLNNLTLLDLGINQLSGSIPKELSNLNNLQDLLLDDNQLNGTIPSELGVLNNLLTFWIDGNQLRGKIPLELRNLTNLNSLNICNNHLYATDPALRDFLDSLQPGWEDCQTPPFCIPMPHIPLLLLE